MAEEGFKRKLAAILSADVEGYSRLMDDDEEATVRTPTSYRTAIADLVQQFRGRVVGPLRSSAMLWMRQVVRWKCRKNSRLEMLICLITAG